jgi:hypothetical protein
LESQLLTRSIENMTFSSHLVCKPEGLTYGHLSNFQVHPEAIPQYVDYSLHQAISKFYFLVDP